MNNIDTNKKPENMTQLYWDYLKGEIDVEDMTKTQFNAFIMEHYKGYRTRGGEKSFKEFLMFIEETGL